MLFETSRWQQLHERWDSNIATPIQEEHGAAAEPQAVIQFKCEFCGAAILGKPHIEYIDGGRYYFSSEECAKAYRQRLVGKRA